MILKVGDILTCHTSCFMNVTLQRAVTAGKSYKIREVRDGKYYIHDDQDERHSFPYDSYEKWFVSIKITRKEKLKKINKSW